MIKIVLLEDNPVDALKIELMLTEANRKHQYKLLGVFTTLPSLIEYLQYNEVDIVLSDIYIGPEPSGIELLQYLQKKQVPVIMMTSSSDNKLYTAAQQLKPVHYLIKPFHSLTFHSTLENVIFDYEQSKQYKFIDQKYLYLSGLGGQREQVWFDDIVYLSSELNNCFIYTNKKKYVTKKSLNKILTEELGDGFLRIHQQYVVNKMHLQAIKQDNVVITGEVILPIGKSFRKDLLSFIKSR
jgi:DNA-binding LytR/AlgR family response regulator